MFHFFSNCVRVVEEGLIKTFIRENRWTFNFFPDVNNDFIFILLERNIKEATYNQSPAMPVPYTDQSVRPSVCDIASQEHIFPPLGPIQLILHPQSVFV